LPEGIEEELNQKAPDWKISGKYVAILELSLIPGTP
jgi:hypothetical protein